MELCLSSWGVLNTELATASEERCRELIKLEIGGRRRPIFILRIYSRFNRTRAARERTELLRGDTYDPL